MPVELNEHAIPNAGIREQQARVGEVLAGAHITADASRRNSADERIGEVKTRDPEIPQWIDIGAFPAGHRRYGFTHVRDAHFVDNARRERMGLAQYVILIGGISEAAEIGVDSNVAKVRVPKSQAKE